MRMGWWRGGASASSAELQHWSRHGLHRGHREEPSQTAEDLEKKRRWPQKMA